MSDRLKALREKRGRIYESMKAITEKAESEKRDMTAEEVVEHRKLFDEQDGFRGQIEAEERQAELDRQMADRSAKEAEERAARERKGAEAPEAEVRMAAFRSYLLNGAAGMSPDERRALQADVSTSGGYLVAPQEFVARLIKAVDNMVFIRGKATVFSLPNAESMGAPSLDADPDDFDWTSELATGNEDSAMKFGKRELKPNPMAKRIKVSKTLLRKSVLPVDQIVEQRLAYKVGVTQEKAFLTGNGAAKPLGVFVASNNGISTGRDVATGNSTTAVAADGLINAKMSLKAQYWAKADWIFHRDVFSAISKLKDGDGQYMWRQSLTAGEPDTLLGRPVSISEYAPNTFTTGLYVGILGDFSNYWIADALDLQIQRLTELYAETNQDGFIGRYEGDGMPVLEEAFARVALA